MARSRFGFRCAGSSPRTRGTGRVRLGDGAAVRFIPADAGNGATSCSPRTTQAVHPRGRGERPSSPGVASALDGSSPRTRGTGGNAMPIKARGRFIPADAGNGGRQAMAKVQRPVHPRGRGERAVPHVPIVERYGSSPRTRGTGAYRCRVVACGRFIPADAGNGGRGVVRQLRLAVHPRGRGERSVGNRAHPVANGSSPRTRGTAWCRPSPHSGCRFIPADAGNGLTERGGVDSHAVHPRGRGERTLDREFC